MIFRTSFLHIRFKLGNKNHNNDPQNKDEESNLMVSAKLWSLKRIRIYRNGWSLTLSSPPFLADLISSYLNTSFDPESRLSKRNSVVFGAKVVFEAGETNLKYLDEWFDWQRCTLFSKSRLIKESALHPLLFWIISKNWVSRKNFDCWNPFWILQSILRLWLKEQRQGQRKWVFQFFDKCKL